MIENRKEYKFVLNNNEIKNLLTIFGDKLNVLHQVEKSHLFILILWIIDCSIIQNYLTQTK